LWLGPRVARQRAFEFLEDLGKTDIALAEGITGGTTSRGVREHGHLDLAKEQPVFWGNYQRL
jgi:hypothetical protein